MINKSKKILCEISPGDLLDKISILEIKIDKIKDKKHLKEINKEYKLLIKVKNQNIRSSNKINKLSHKIKKINLNLWNIEDEIRICEKEKNFGKKFIKLARNVYFNNDKRAQIKLHINKILSSNIKEIKQYANY